MSFINGQGVPAKLPTVFQVRIEALKSNFCVNGRPAKVGEIYTVDQDIANSLEHLGKARKLAWAE